ncbi:hypothetical protein [Friedmanniella luteola]|nr:hypothetical protein [Friedmanniella luteola]
MTTTTSGADQPLGDPAGELETVHLFTGGAMPTGSASPTPA